MIRLQLLGLFLVAASLPAIGEISLVPEHAGNRLPMGATPALEANRISVELTEPGVYRVILKATAPTIIKQSTGATFRLVPGWDGSLGYSLYGLEMESPTLGRAEALLSEEPKPSTHSISTQADLEVYKRSLEQRASKFPDDPAAFQSWQVEYRNGLTERLMGGRAPERGPLHAEELERIVHPKFELVRVQYNSRPGRKTELLVSMPGEQGPHPVLVALHGHETDWGEAVAGAYEEGHADDFCAYFANRGWLVLQPASMDHKLHTPGWTLQGEWTWDAMTALDYALTLPGVDADRVAVCGLSTGGHLAMNLLALDDRIKAGVVGCVLSTWNHYKRFRIPPHCDCGIGFQLPTVLSEQCDWAALAAPKPVQFQHGKQDAAFCPGASPMLLQLGWNTGVLPEEEYQAMFAEVRRAYRLAGAKSRVETHYHPDKHQVDNPAAFDWLTRAFGLSAGK